MTRKQIPLYLCGACAVVCALVWYGVYYIEASRNLVVRFFDVGQGDGIFFELPNHVQVLIDGGPGSAILSKLGSIMPFWDHTIDLVILTHPHADHVDGLIDVATRYQIGMVIESGSFYGTPDYDAWNQLIKKKDIPVVYARQGQHVVLSDMATLRVLFPQQEIIGKRFANIHDGMVVSKLTYGSTSILFMGDAEKPIEYQLMGSGIPLAADVLKVGHHGSKTSTTQGFLQAVHPRFAVISVGKKNRYGHPHQEVIDRIRDAGIDLLRTDSDGDIVLTSDGKEIKPQN